MSSPSSSVRLGAIAGLAAVLVGIGIGRFAYAPLIPALIGAQWFTPGEAAWLGTANLAGYMLGALAAGQLARWPGLVAALRGAMLLACAACFAGAWPVNFLWYAVWRCAAGCAGGAIMVLGAPSILAHVPPARRGLVSGVIFAGIGLGVVASASLVPLLLRMGLQQTWLGLGVVSLALTGLGWRGWPAELTEPAPRPSARPGRAPLLPGFLLAYGLNAVALVPHMVFFVDFVTRFLGRGIAAGAADWVAFGLGAIAGPLALGTLADAIGFGRALRLGFVVQAVAIAIPVWLHGTWPLALSAFIVGGFTPGVVPLAIGRLRELLPGDAAAQRRAWARATAVFALGMAASSSIYAALFAHGASYATLFALGAAAVLLALPADLMTRPRRA